MFGSTILLFVEHSNIHHARVRANLVIENAVQCTCLGTLLVGGAMVTQINYLRGCLSYFHPVNFASKIILPETLSTERLYLGKN